MVRIIFAFTLIVLIYSCSQDKLPEKAAVCTDSYTYTNQIKPIIDRSCAYVGCHSAGYPLGDYTSYSAMVNNLSNGKFKKWVLDERAMPPSYAPDDKPKSLTDDEITALTCWLNEGFPN